jgi:DNA-binding MarR family transcriptional regulator
METDRYAAWRSLLQAQSTVLRAIEADLVGSGIVAPTWYDVLLQLEGAPLGCYRMQELAEKVVLSRSRVSRLVDEMVAAGMVARAADPSDRRAIHVALTDEGRAALVAARPRYLESIERHFTTHLSEAERDGLVASLSKVAEAHSGCRTVVA